MTPVHTPLMLAALQHAADIAQRIGIEETLTARSREIAAGLLAEPSLPTTVNIREAGQIQQYTVRRQPISAFERKSIKTADLKRRYPAAYAAAVTITPPDHPFHVRLDTLRHGKAATEWAAFKAEGAAKIGAQLTQRFGGVDWSSRTARLTVLHEVRAWKRRTTGRIESEKQALIRFVTDNELPLIIPGHTDGKLELRLNQPKVSVDYDLLAAKFPSAATLIRRTPVAESVRLVFGVPHTDAEGGDDENVFGRWKP